MVVGRTDHLPGGAPPNWVSPKQGSGLMARHAVTLALLINCVIITPGILDTSLTTLRAAIWLFVMLISSPKRLKLL